MTLGVAVLPLYAGATAGGATASASQGEESLRQRQQEVRQQQQDARTALDETTKELSDLSTRLEEAKTAAARNQDALTQARAALEEARAEEVRVAAQLAAAREREKLATEDVTKALAEHESALADVGRSARSAYTGQGDFAVLDIMLASSSFNEYVQRAAMLDRVGQLQGDIVGRAQLKGALSRSAQARQAAAREAVQQASAAAADNRARASQAEEDQARLTADAERLTQEQQALVTEAATRRDAEMARLQVLEQEAVTLEAEMARLAQAARERAAREQAAREQAAREEAARQRTATDRASREAAGRSATTPRESATQAPAAENSGTGLLRPVTGRVTSPFGWRIHPIYGTRRMHRGTDYGNGCGTPVRAAASGSVVSAAAAGGSGNQIVLDHGVVGDDSLGTVYKHLQGYAVRSGQTVSRGQVIGYVGTTGASTGCHLHFEVYDNGVVVDPMTRL